MTETKTIYVPKPGDHVRVRRTEVPCPEVPAGPQRRVIADLTGVVLRLDLSRPGSSMLYLDPDTLDVSVDAFGMDAGDHAMICLGYQFCGQEPGHGYSWTLQTEVEQVVELRVSWALAPDQDGCVGIITSQPDSDRFKPGGQRFSWSCPHRHPSERLARECAQAELDRRQS